MLEVGGCRHIGVNVVVCAATCLCVGVLCLDGCALFMCMYVYEDVCIKRSCSVDVNFIQAQSFHGSTFCN